MNNPIEHGHGHLYELLAVQSVGPGHERVSELAAVRVGGIEAPDTAAVRALLHRCAPAQLGQEMRKMLDVDLFALLAGAWGQVHKVRAALARSLAEPAREHPVDLPQHTLDATLKPRLVVSVSGVDWCDIDFEVSARLKLSSATLSLQAGCLAALRVGTAEGSLRLACEGTEIREFKRELKLLPEYRFMPPLALGQLAAAGPAEPATG
jgi:hypothetical protein